MAGQRALLTVVITDAVGFSMRAGHDEERALAELHADFAIMRAAVEAHGGKVVKSTGDGLLLTFDIPGQAVDCCLDIQTQFLSRGPESLQHRIGVHLCEVVHDGDDVHGDGVNLAARLETQANPGSIAMSQTVYDIVKSRLTVEPRFVGTRGLKNIATPVSVYELSPGGAPKRKAAAVAPKRNWGLALGVSGLIGAIGVLAGVIWVKGSAPPEIIVEKFPEKTAATNPLPNTPPSTQKPAANAKVGIDPRLVARKSEPSRTLSPPRFPKVSTPPSVVTKPQPDSSPQEPLPTTSANISPSEVAKEENPFISDPLPGDLTVRRGRMLRVYDFDGVLNLVNTSPAFRALPYFASQVRTFSQLSRLKTVVDQALKSSSSDEPLSVAYTPIGGTSPVNYQVWGSFDAGMQVRQTDGSVTSMPLRTAPPSLFRAVAAAACKAQVKSGESKQLLAAFDRVYSDIRPSRRAGKASVQVGPTDDNLE